MIAFILILILGFNGAIYLVLGGIMVNDGYNGLFSACLHALGSAVSLIVACRVMRQPIRWKRVHLKYYVICAFLGLIGPAVSTFWVIPHIGTGLMAAVIATSPLFTALFSHLLKVEPFNRILSLGIAIGFFGAAIIILGEVSWPTAPNKYIWLLISVIVPICLALGNVARSALWPTGLTPIQAGSGISLVALMVSICLTPFFEPKVLVELPQVNSLWIMAAFTLLNGISAFPFFYLQKIGGPTLLSLLSHAMAGFGLLLGAFFFGETYRFLDFLGVGLILIGVSSTSYFRHQRTQKLTFQNANASNVHT